MLTETITCQKYVVKRNVTRPAHKVSPVVRAPAGLLGFHDVEGVYMTRLFRGVFSTSMHHLSVDQDDTT